MLKLVISPPGLARSSTVPTCQLATLLVNLARNSAPPSR